MAHHLTLEEREVIAQMRLSGRSQTEITGISKRGWDHLWVRYQDAEDSTAKALVKRPVAAYVERVYYDGDFSGLGIGG